MLGARTGSREALRIWNMRGFLTSIGFVVAGRQEYLGVVDRVRSGLAVIQVRPRYPFGVAAGVLRVVSTASPELFT